MTVAAAQALRTVAFGDLEAALWGVLFGAEHPSLAMLRTTDGATLADATLEGSGESEEWQITGASGDLVLSAVGEAAPATVADGAQIGFDQLCRVRGRVRVADAEREVDCLGTRGWRDHSYVLQFDSLRAVSAWFEPDEGVALSALRPRKAAGHATDAVTAVVFETDGALPVVDPRVSSTYSAADTVSRVGLELWIGEEDSEQYPRRVAGEALSSGVIGHSSGFTEIRATLLHCHSRGREGAGVYLLARRG